MTGSSRSLSVIYAFAFAIIALAANAFAQSPSSAYDFDRDIRPILSGKCFQCHGPDAAAREADLRLDQRGAAIAFGAIVPGSPSESELIDRVSSHDADLRMPPNRDPLSAAQISMLSAWIKDGAKYEKHWSFQPPKQPDRPAVTDQSWPSGELDYFILNRIEQAGLKPSPKAEPAVLLRRLHLDLIGLPPSIEEVTAFEADPSPKNYEAVVDRLLKSKHFGEKWATGWLDLARYADSNGYQHDDLRTMWPYRDWVIQALNDDMPFDLFTTEQLAGDLLPNPSTSQLVATGFHRNVPANFSGGSKVDEVRANILHDRVSTTGQVWLGLTLECAQCHDHKFDPLPQRDYYQLYAYFNQAIPEVAQEGVGMFKKKFVGAEVTVYASENDRQRALKLRGILAEEEQQLANDNDDAKPGGQTTILDFEQIDPVKVNNTSHPATTSVAGDVPSGSGKRAAKTVAKASVKAGFFGTGFSFPATDLSKAAAVEFWIKTDIVGQFNFQVHNQGNQASVFTFSTAGVEPQTWTKIKAPVTSFKVPPWSTGAVDWSSVQKCQVTSFGSGPYAGRYIMLDNVVAVMPSARDLRIKRIAELREQLGKLETSTMVMQDADEPQPTHIMIRGDYTTPGDRVKPGTITALHPPAAELPRNRLGLAKWLMAPENPLTARVTVNRLWAEIFGRGIVTTPEDFGLRSAPPTHPELLDWLATEFVRKGWSIKQIIKTMVMSSTYQQNSAIPQEQIRRDPKNTLYARGPRLRLSAELVRDNLLAISGLLSKKIGGPPVYPEQPDGLWKDISTADVTEYPTSEGEDRYRRGLYTFLRRGNPNPSILNFDGTNRSACVVRRDRSNTPVQALNLLNDPVYVEAARALATLIERTPGDARKKVVTAFRRAVAREPSEAEVKTLLALYRKHGDWFSVAQVILNLDETITKS